MLRSEHGLVDEALQLLSRADRSWTSVSGTIETWADEALLDLGRADFHARRETQLPDWMEHGAGVDALEVTNRFWVTFEPWQARMECVREVLPASGVYDRSPNLRIIHDATWWAIDGGVVRTNAGSAKRSWMSIEDLQLLLAPGTLVEALDVFAACRTESEGRAAIRLASAPTQLLIRLGPGLVVLNAAEYALTVDAERGIVVRYEAFTAGRPARRHTISDLILDAPLDQSLFVPPGRWPVRRIAGAELSYLARRSASMRTAYKDERTVRSQARATSRPQASPSAHRSVPSSPPYSISVPPSHSVSLKLSTT